MTTVAVLIPSFKPDRYIKRCFQSLDQQSLGKHEFVVYMALNGPKNGYEELIKEIVQKYSFNFKYFYLENAGVSNARNYLIRNSTEPYIVFLDDDDFISEDYLEDLSRKVLPNSIVISNVYNVHEKTQQLLTNYLNQCYKTLSAVETSKFKTRKYFSTAWAKIIPREVIGDTRFDTKLAIGEDSLFMAEISSKVEKVIKSKESACYYRVLRDGSALRSKPDRRKEFNRLYYLLKKYSLMLTRKKYDNAFVVSRIAATIMHFKRLFK